MREATKGGRRLLFRQTDAKQRGKRLRVGDFRVVPGVVVALLVLGAAGLHSGLETGWSGSISGARLSTTVVARLRGVGPAMQVISGFGSHASNFGVYLTFNNFFHRIHLREFCLEC